VPVPEGRAPRHLVFLDLGAEPRRCCESLFCSTYFSKREACLSPLPGPAYFYQLHIFCDISAKEKPAFLPSQALLVTGFAGGKAWQEEEQKASHLCCFLTNETTK